jgi:hypothetical protein
LPGGSYSSLSGTCRCHSRRRTTNTEVSSHTPGRRSRRDQDRGSTGSDQFSARGIDGRAGYRSWLLVVLVVIALAQRRLGPSSRPRPRPPSGLPSSAVQLRCWSRPTTPPGCPLTATGRRARPGRATRSR